MEKAEEPPKRKGWHWTRRGWVRNRPKRRADPPVPKVPRKRRLRRQVVVAAAVHHQKPAFAWRAPLIPQDTIFRLKGLAPSIGSLNQEKRPTRAAWHGKYAALETLSLGAKPDVLVASTKGSACEGTAPSL